MSRSSKEISADRTLQIVGKDAGCMTASWMKETGV